eukprot:1159817-Pelagomonas_calceolata.AAC.3
MQAVVSKQGGTAGEVKKGSAACAKVHKYPIEKIAHVPSSARWRLRQACSVAQHVRSRGAGLG